MAVRDGELSWNALQLSYWIARVIVLVKLPTRGSRQLCHRRLHKCHCLCHVARTRIRYRKQAPRGLQQGLDICNRAPRLQLADDCERRSNCMGCKDKDEHHSERHVNLWGQAAEKNLGFLVNSETRHRGNLKIRNSGKTS